MVDNQTPVKDTLIWIIVSLDKIELGLDNWLNPKGKNMDMYRDILDP